MTLDDWMTLIDHTVAIVIIGVIILHILGVFSKGE